MTSDPQTLLNEAIGAFERGGGSAALAITTRLIDAGSAPADAFGIRGMVLAQRKDWHRALADLKAAVAGGSQRSDVVRAFADCAARLGGPQAAAEQLKSLLDAQPTNVPLRLSYASMAGALVSPATELSVLAVGLQMAPDDLQLLQAAGAALIENGNLDQALPVVEKFRAADPQNPEAAHMCGTAYLQLGDTAKANDAFLDAMTREPAYPRSFMAFSRTPHTELAAATVAEQLEAAQTRVRRAGDDDAVHLYYGIGHLLEAKGDYAEAFRAYTRGGATRSRQVPYDRRTAEARANAIKAAFPARVFQNMPATGNDTTAPIFVLGLPRSGSTLTEQILSSHSQVEGLGEMPVFPNLAGPQLGRLASGGAFSFDWAALADSYLEGVAPFRKEVVPHFVDKTLINASLVGFLHLAFPNAKIIQTKRYILDTCVSCFALRFLAGHEWSYRLSDIAHYVSVHQGLMDHWEDVLPGRITTLDYDLLVADFETEVRALVDACGLEWEDACLAPHLNRRAVSTSSNAQVRKPVNRASQGRWRRFEAELAPLREALGL